MQSRSIIPHPRERNRHSPTRAVYMKRATRAAYQEHNKRLVESGYPSYTRIRVACREAAEEGHLECLKWARENGCPWIWDACADAAQVGHLECLKYAHENGCPWDSYTCNAAAEAGQLECLKYAHEDGCPIEIMSSYLGLKS